MLMRCELFRHLTPRSLTEMADHLQSESFGPNEIVIREGDPGDKFYLIRQGRVSVRRGPQGHEVAVLGEGDFFGEIALLEDKPRNATVVTLEPSILYSLSKPEFRKAMAEQASFEAEIRTSLFDRQ